jgi:hypothetical protein
LTRITDHTRTAFNPPNTRSARDNATQHLPKPLTKKRSSEFIYSCS